ncbi:hypothetical protein M9Y10_009130 [Tritrichomonas musculus]|uniref:Intimal thickness related receptor IRP domain-containing protein n=1 Tax=Tritrichomonas musculus TaxID=1915356 RepID=A0ABR2J007_9EUKA
MLFFLLFFNTVSEVGSDQIVVNQPFAVISSFGFHANATFHLSIRTDIESRLLLFMMTAKMARKTDVGSIYHPCLPEYKNTFISDINHTNFSVSTEFEWESTIHEKDIYYPVIVNCLSNHTQYDIEYNYNNYKYLIDYRNEYFSLVLLIFTAIHIFISAIWLLNTALNQSFCIPIQFIFSLLPSIRSFKCVIQAYYWEQKKIMESVPSYVNLTINVLSGVYFFIFLSTTSLVFSGVGVYKTKCNLTELFEVCFSSFALVFGFFSGINSQSLKIILLSLTLNMLGFLWFMKINTDNFVNFVKILDSSISNERMLKRIRLIRNFMISTFVCLALTVVVFSCSAVEISEIARVGILEVAIIMLEFVELYFFYLRKEYEGAKETNNETSSLGPVFLDCPNMKFLCILTKVETQSKI